MLPRVGPIRQMAFGQRLFARGVAREFRNRLGATRLWDGQQGPSTWVTMADPDTYHMAARQPERYELVRVRMGGWTEYFAAMFPAHHDQHLRRPYFVPEEPPAGRIG